MRPIQDNLPGKNFKPRFILDTAATRHIVCDKNFLTAFVEYKTIVRWGNAKNIQINGKGDLYIRFSNNKIVYKLKDCLYMPEIGVNIISQPSLQADLVTTFHGNKCQISSDGKIIAQGQKFRNLFYLDIDNIIMPTEIYHLDQNAKHDCPPGTHMRDISTAKDTDNKTIDISDLHHRMGHIGYNNLLRVMHNTNGYSKLNNLSKTRLQDCEICLQGKFSNKINKSSSDREFSYLEKISSDICGPISPCTYDNFKYFITFLDIKTRYLEIKLLRSKDEAYDAFLQYSNIYENNANNKRIRILATDNGSEYVNKRFRSLLNHKGIVHQLSPTYTKEPNGIIERINRTIINKIRCLLAHANLPKYLWGEACITATYLYNRTPHSSLDFKTPFEMKYGEKPNISNLKTFGSMTFFKNKGNHIKKLDDKALRGILVGFNENLCKIFNPSTRKCLWSRDFHILENKFYNFNEFKEQSPASQEIDKVTIPFIEYFPSNNKPNPLNNQAVRQHTASSLTNTDHSVSNQNNQIRVSNTPDENSNKKIQASFNGQALKINKISGDLSPFQSQKDDTLDELAFIVNINDEPNTFKQAISSPQKQDWLNAMQAEIDELESQNTWTRTTLPHDKIPLKGRWVYKIKSDLDGNIVKYKARWVVKGFNQILGVDYLDTFSTTCRPESYRIIFILAMHNTWRLTQYDVKNAFIHAKIDKEIYVEQPVGFEMNQNDQEKPLYCKLNKALYGLKQSPRLWYEHLLDLLKQFGFETMTYDSAIFIHSQSKIIIICHVDDLIITGPDNNKITDIIGKLSKMIKLTKIGNINQFLGMQIKTDYKNRSLKINQNKYTQSLLEKFNKVNLHPVTSPVELGINLEKSLQPANNYQINQYQQQVGSLIYLAINSRPDISFAVNRCARYMSNPNDSHFRALDRIWKYLNKYPDIGLTYDCSLINNNILGYTDADWGGDTTNRKSTSGYIFSLNNNIISWFSTQQKTVALSSCEAEYMSFKEAIKESIYLNNILKYFYRFLNLEIPNEIPRLLTDSESAIKLANNPEFHKRSKHIDITYHFIRDTIKTQQIILLHVGTKDQKADGFTKGLDTIKHNSFLQSLNLKR